MSIEYGKAEDMWWDVVKKEACMNLDIDGNIIRCRVSKRWIAENCGASGTGLEYFDAAKARFSDITDRLGPKALAGVFEEDGSVLLR